MQGRRRSGPSATRRQEALEEGGHRGHDGAAADRSQGRDAKRQQSYHEHTDPGRGAVAPSGLGRPDLQRFGCFAVLQVAASLSKCLVCWFPLPCRCVVDEGETMETNESGRTRESRKTQGGGLKTAGLVLLLVGFLAVAPMASGAKVVSGGEYPDCGGTVAVACSAYHETCTEDGCAKSTCIVYTDTGVDTGSHPCFN